MQRIEAAEDEMGLSCVEARERCVCEVLVMFKQQNSITKSVT